MESIHAAPARPRGLSESSKSHPNGNGRCNGPGDAGDATARCARLRFNGRPPLRQAPQEGEEACHELGARRRIEAARERCPEAEVRLTRVAQEVHEGAAQVSFWNKLRRMRTVKAQPPRTTPTRRLRAKKAPKKKVYTDLAAYKRARGGIPIGDYGDD